MTLETVTPQIEDALKQIRRLIQPPTAEIAHLHLQAMTVAARPARARRARKVGVQLLAAATLTLGAGALALPLVSRGDDHRALPGSPRPEGVSEGRAAQGAPPPGTLEVGQPHQIDALGASGGSSAHGQLVSALARATEPGPQHGKTVSALASSTSQGHRQDAEHRSAGRGKSADPHGKGEGRGNG